ncbi:MAG: NAD(P)-binding domain-containing protein [Rubrivivax sp.]
MSARSGVPAAAGASYGAVDVVVIGAGHSGLAMSRVLAERSIAHVVLERGDVANAWRTERWDSLRLLTPSWMCRLPGQAYEGADPDGFMSAADVAAFIAGYAARSHAPVRTHTTVQRVEREAGGGSDGYVVHTDRGTWRCRAVVLASGACSRPQVPALAADVPPTVAQWTTHDYRRPGDLGEGGVLVVGASATGLQLALEIGAAAAACCWPAASTCACRAFTAAATCSGGCSPAACSTSASKRWTTCCARAACLRRSSWAATTVRRST